MRPPFPAAFTFAEPPAQFKRAGRSDARAAICRHAGRVACRDASGTRNHMVRILRRLNLAPAGMVACILLLCPLVHGAAAVTPAGKRIGWPPGFAHKVAIIGPTDDRVELSKVPGLKEIGF